MGQVRVCQMRVWSAGGFVLAAVAAALVPLLDRSTDTAMAASRSFPGWPTHHEGRALAEMALTDREAAFLRDFPGRVGRFSDGSRELIIRWVGAPTRRLHSAADCLRGSGYSVEPAHVTKDASGAAMGCFRANGPDGTMKVCEVIRDQQGNTWPDVSAWYWNALFGATSAPWWSFVVAERE